MQLWVILSKTGIRAQQLNEPAKGVWVQVPVVAVQVIQSVKQKGKEKLDPFQ